MNFSSTRINNISSIINTYDLWFIDLYGVIHGGGSIFQHAYDALKTLQKYKKHVFFISNAPRPANEEKKKIISLGISDNLFLDLLTSGSSCIRFLSEYDMPLGRKFYYFGMPHNRALLTHLPNLIETDTLSEAQFIILSGPLEWGKIPSDYMAFFEKALSLKIPIVCPNADKRVSLNDTIFLCAGSFAHHYEKIGGIVYWFGKPHLSIYEEAINLLTYNKITIPDKKRIIMVGDSLETDMPGAINFGIDSLLCHKTGIHAAIAEKTLFDTYKIHPTYIIDSFTSN